MKKITIYTDGACSGNPGKGGWGAVIINADNTLTTLSGACKLTTNSRMEIQAVVEALKHIKTPMDITIISDSQYVCSTINEWLDKWQKSGKLFSKANVDLWMEYLELSEQHKIHAEHVYGHSGVLFNEMCDKLARNAIKSI